ncbi:hypothetical protein AVL59_36920 [Streptomyces griseochromogenes]|uniref:Uncharacterized protein n=1 Tax=Streptomyces griseochromogenes TaxID=68214 RepID=A0A1B1B6L2_9ACTN|nr:hypothetical protein AVL59_36920 [Streptomyces griseochromogenes]
MRAVLASAARGGTDEAGVAWAEAVSARAGVPWRASGVRRWSMRIPMPAVLRLRGAGGVLAGAT